LVRCRLPTLPTGVHAESDPKRLLPELVREARQMRREREGNDPSRLRELREEARAMRLERRLREKRRL